MTPNAYLAYRVLDHITQHPETWKQGRWWCGTGGCFAGWAVNLSGGNLVDIDRRTPYGNVVTEWFVRDGDYKDSVADAALEALGLGDIHEGDGDPELFPLFDHKNTLDDLRAHVYTLFGPRPDDMPEVVNA